MDDAFQKIIKGYQEFKNKYIMSDSAIMNHLADQGQHPKIMIVACCDSRVDPALILQCDPGDLFVVRNVANIVPPYQKDEAYHGTSAALEFGICFLKVQHLIILGHSQCGGIYALLTKKTTVEHDFIANWVSIIDDHDHLESIDGYAKKALLYSRSHCMTFPWIKKAVEEKSLKLHLWFFNIKAGELLAYDDNDCSYHVLSE